MPFTRHGHPYGMIRAEDMPPLNPAHCGGVKHCGACRAEAEDAALIAEVAARLGAPLDEPRTFDPRQSQWRVDDPLGRTIYAQTPEGGDLPLGMMDTRELAEHIVALQNRGAF